MEEFEIVGVTTSELIAILEAESLMAEVEGDRMAEIEMGLWDFVAKRGGL